MAEKIVVGRRSVRAMPNRSPRKQAPVKKHGFGLGKSKHHNISKVSKTKPAKKKHGLKMFKKYEDSVKSNNDAELNLGGAPIKSKNVLIREQLTGPAKLIGDGELDMLVKMDTSVNYIQKRMQSRLVVAIICVCVGLVAGIVVSKSFGILFGLGLALAGLTWYMDQRKTVDFFRKFQLKRQIAFSQFTRLAAAYLPELKDGTNLYSIFAKIVPRMGDQRDTAALQKLMIDMQNDPDDSGPFLEFAHEFSVSNRAELVMLTIQQMYRGDVEDESIRSLANDANEDMIKQCDTIIAFKLKHFDNLTARIGICAMIPIIGYFTLLVGSTVGDALGSITGSIKH